MLLFLFIIFSCYSKIVKSQSSNIYKKIKRFSKNNKKLILSFSFLFIVTLLLFIFFKNKKYNLEETQGELVSLQDAPKELEQKKQDESGNEKYNKDRKIHNTDLSDDKVDLFEIKLSNMKKIKQIIEGMFYKEHFFSFLPENFERRCNMVGINKISENICLNTFENYYELRINHKDTGRQLNLLFPKEGVELNTKEVFYQSYLINIDKKYSITVSGSSIYVNTILSFVLNEKQINIRKNFTELKFETMTKTIEYNDSSFIIKDEKDKELKLNNNDDLKKISEFFESLKNTEYSGD